VLILLFVAAGEAFDINVVFAKRCKHYSITIASAVIRQVSFHPDGCITSIYGGVIAFPIVCVNAVTVLWDVPPACACFPGFGGRKNLPDLGLKTLRVLTVGVERNLLPRGVCSITPSNA
jgi:hypothetical protein